MTTNSTQVTVDTTISSAQTVTFMVHHINELLADEIRDILMGNLETSSLDVLKAVRDLVDSSIELCEAAGSDGDLLMSKDGFQENIVKPITDKYNSLESCPVDVIGDEQGDLKT